MNATTEREVKQIESRGFYFKGQTLGEGGWAAILKFAGNWATYHLFDGIDPEPISTVHAPTTEVAVMAFEKLFHLKDMEWEVVREDRKFTRVAPL
jgi:muconolactone delta-isomerase